MKQIPSGTEQARPFLPAKDFELSKAFYEALGFEKLLDGEVAIFRMGSSGFILQRGYQKEWAENFMMQLMVDDLDAWWTHIQALDLPGQIQSPGSAPAGHAAMGPSDRLCLRSVWGALARCGTARRGDPRLTQGTGRPTGSNSAPDSSVVASVTSAS